MRPTRVLYAMVRADFLERVRRYSFLLTLAFSLYLGYAVYAGQVTLQSDGYRGEDNSAWVGAVIGLVGSVWISLVGFYVVKNSIQRDRQTRVGQILATTPISKSFYTLAKALSNFAVLGSMVVVLAIAAIAIVGLGHGHAPLELFPLLSPVLLLGLSAVAITAALAVLFESLPVLRGGLGNVIYFFLWTALLTLGAAAVDSGASSRAALVDYTGIATVVGQIQTQLHQLDPLYKGGGSFSVGGLNQGTKTFLWTGIQWTPVLLLSRLLMLAIATLLALFAAVFFDRFDPARTGWVAPGGWLAGAKPKRAGKSRAEGLAYARNGIELPTQGQVAARLTPVPRNAVRSRFVPLIVAELRLLLRGYGWWWYAGAAGLFIACVASPMDAARTGLLPAAWIWPVLIWSQMGTREAQWSTGALIFSAPRAMPRQLLASYAAGVIVALATGGGLALHLLFLRDLAGLGAWAAGALFIPALALALGVCSGSRKFFEALYTAWWYMGPMHHIRQIDFMGTTAASSTPIPYLAATVLLVLVAYSWRKVKLASA